MASPRIKFCGITSLSDARLAVEAGAWALGTILWPGSERHCDPAEAARIAGELRRQAEIAGVFVNQPLDDVVRAVADMGLTHVQLHGDEGPSFCSAVAQRSGARVIKAIRVHSRADVIGAERFHTDLHMLDGPGNGQAWDWSLASARRSRTPLLLAGGLTAANVGEGIEALHPWGVDVASGVESAPGVKDPERLRDFFAAVEAASHAGAGA